MLALALCPSIPAGACSIDSCMGRGKELRPGFAVKITHKGKALDGVAVDVVTNGSNDKLFSGITGRDGVVYVSNLPAGDYWLKGNFRIPKSSIIRSGTETNSSMVSLRVPSMVASAKSSSSLWVSR